MSGLCFLCDFFVGDLSVTCLSVFSVFRFLCGGGFGSTEDSESANNENADSRVLARFRLTLRFLGGELRAFGRKILGSSGGSSSDVLRL